MYDLLFTWHKSTKYCTVSVIQRARYLLTCINVTASNILGQHYSGKHYSNHSVFLRFSPSPNGSWLTKAGVDSSIELTSMTSPLAGEMRSLAAFTLSKAPKSSDDTNRTRLHSFNKSQRYIKKDHFICRKLWQISGVVRMRWSFMLEMTEQQMPTSFIW